MNTAYALAKKAFLDGDIDLLVETVKLQAYDGAVYNAAHDFLNDLAGTKVGAAVTLTGKTTTAGKFAATVPDFTLPTGSTVNALVLYVDGATDALRRLVGFIDRKADGTTLALSTTGGITAAFVWSGPLLSLGGT